MAGRVSSVSSLGRSGLYDWMVQRVSAVLMLAYILFLVIVLVRTPDMQYADWQAIFALTWVKIFSLITLLALCAHAWVGMWTIATDYLTGAMLGSAATCIRFGFQSACLIVLLAYFVWGVQILWSV
ncbi:MAG: succinate dehydrogenase, hydrophobic membrane anchor protein [Pseudomonadales bacterium]|nr:succinate dehydrogenase, hydrophobic membrane anchor protein [Pseudomonadales bacterium]